jgi:hypothetical protein
MGLSLEPHGNASLQDLLRKRRSYFLTRWFQRILDEYEEETASFLKSRHDRFANPVAFALREATEEIYQALVDGRDVDRRPLEYAMKIRAVQESDSLSGIRFVHLLKETVREALGDSVSGKDFADFGSRIDEIAAIASEMFVSNREKIATISAISRMR